MAKLPYDKVKFGMSHLTCKFNHHQDAAFGKVSLDCWQASFNSHTLTTECSSSFNSQSPYFNGHLIIFLPLHTSPLDAVQSARWEYSSTFYLPHSWTLSNNQPVDKIPPTLPHLLLVPFHSPKIFQPLILAQGITKKEKEKKGKAVEVEEKTGSAGITTITTAIEENATNQYL
jgi:hypothetical protein